jgi:hypothetical protein
MLLTGHHARPAQAGVPCAYRVLPEACRITAQAHGPRLHSRKGLRQACVRQRRHH